MEILKDHKQISSLTWIGSQYQFSVIIALRRDLEYLHFDIFGEPVLVHFNPLLKLQMRRSKRTVMEALEASRAVCADTEVNFSENPIQIALCGNLEIFL